MIQSLRVATYPWMQELILLITAGQVVVTNATDTAGVDPNLPVVFDFPDRNIHIQVNLDVTVNSVVETIDVSMIINNAGMTLAEQLLHPYVKPRTIRTTEETFTPVFVMLLNELFN